MSWNRVKIQQLAWPLEDFVGERAHWKDFADAWADIQPTGGREDSRSQEEIGTTTHRVRIRYMPGITSTMRLKWGDRFLQISRPPVNEGENNRWLDFDCTEVEELWQPA